MLRQWGPVQAGMMRHYHLERPGRSAERCGSVPKGVALSRNAAADLHGKATRPAIGPLAGPQNASRRSQNAVQTLRCRLERPGASRSFLRIRPKESHAATSRERANAPRSSRLSAGHSTIDPSTNGRGCRPSLSKRLAGQLPAQAQLAGTVDPQRSGERQKRSPKRHKPDEGAKSTTFVNTKNGIPEPLASKYIKNLSGITLSVDKKGCFGYFSYPARATVRIKRNPAPAICKRRVRGGANPLHCCRCWPESSASPVSRRARRRPKVRRP